MKILLALLISLPFISLGQDKTIYVDYNKITPLEGTSYVIASAQARTKLSIEGRSLLFINTQTGEVRQVDFPKDGSIGTVEQIKIDSLQINKVIVSGQTVNLDGSKRIDWDDPRQVFIYSTDGAVKTQVTDNNYFTDTWVINKHTGVLVITGHVDSNNNKKYDDHDKNEILLYDLKKMTLLKKL